MKEMFKSNWHFISAMILKERERERKKEREKVIN